MLHPQFGQDVVEERQRRELEQFAVMFDLLSGVFSRFQPRGGVHLEVNHVRFPGLQDINHPFQWAITQEVFNVVTFITLGQNEMNGVSEHAPVVLDQPFSVMDVNLLRFNPGNGESASRLFFRQQQG